MKKNEMILRVGFTLFMLIALFGATANAKESVEIAKEKVRQFKICTIEINDLTKMYKRVCEVYEIEENVD